MATTLQDAAPATPATTVSLDEERIKRICTAIRAEETRLRHRYPILKHQDAIGVAVLLLSLAGMIVSGYLYVVGVLPAYLSIPLSALFASLSHELEHDLIHRLYFKRHRVVQNLMMLVVWMMRPNTVNPWYRRDIHFLHHKVSGTPQDLEERLVGNGVAHPLTRLIVMGDGLLGILLRVRVLNAENRRFNVFEVINAGFPFATAYFATWYVFLLYHGALLASSALGVGLPVPVWLGETMSIVNLLVVVLVAPNVLRSFCLNLVTSYMHYYGGVTTLMQQTQILRPWFLLPAQLFCFNFGSTHGIHHFVVSQPFYLRQMVASAAHEVMRANGVRYNDFSTFSGSNRYHPSGT
jgi:fatty acid desaturase